MLLSRWLKTFQNAPRPARRTRKPWNRIPAFAQVEVLEDRCLLATFVVSNLNDSGAGSLRQAVVDANSNGNPSETDQIRFDPALLNTSRVIALTSGQITISQSVRMIGPSFDPGGIIISGNNDSRVFSVSSTAGLVGLQFLTITRGNTSGDGGALLNQGPNTALTDAVVSSNRATFGGGIANTNGGRLVIQRTQIISNSASSDGGGIDNFTNGTLIIDQSTIANNIADSGGGVVNESGAAQLIIRSSTINNNTASSGPGGGIANRATTLEDDAILIQNSTIVGNISTFGGGGISSEAGAVMAANVTIANNIDFDGNASSGAGGISRTGGGTITGLNLVVSQNNSNSGNDELNSGALNGTGTQANFIGGEPRLGPLQDNGGPTFTMLPLPGSPVLGNGAETSQTPLRDQRGFARNVSSSGNTSPSVDQGAVEFFPTLTQPFAVAPGANPGNLEKAIFDAAAGKQQAGQARFKSNSYPGFGGEVHVAVADINGDGTRDIITGAGAGGGPHIVVRNGIDPSQVLHSFFAFDQNFTGGIYVAAGDIDGDGTKDIIVGMASGGALVRVFDGTNPGNLIGEVNPFAGFGGGVRVASGDIDGDGRADVIIAAGPGAGSHVVVFSGVQVSSLPNPNVSNALIAGPLASFFPYSAFPGGTFVATGDIDNNGRTDIITGAGAGGGPHVLVFTNTSPAPIVSFFAYATGFTGGVRVGAVDFDGDEFDDIVTGAGPGGGPHVRILNSRVLTVFGQIIELQSFFAFDPSFAGGVFVAGSKVEGNSGSPLRIAEGFLPPETAAPDISASDLAGVAEAAIDRFAAAGVSAEEIARLENVTIEIADLTGDLLALAFTSSIVIDADAAGFGYFVDQTPGDDVEFQTATGQAISEAAQGRIDLLSVIAHEFAHVLGHSDLDADLHPDHLLADRLAPGVRRFVDEDDLDALDSAFHPDSLADWLE